MDKVKFSKKGKTLAARLGISDYRILHLNHFIHDHLSYHKTGSTLPALETLLNKVAKTQEERVYICIAFGKLVNFG